MNNQSNHREMNNQSNHREMKPHDKIWEENFEDFEFKDPADERMTIASALGEPQRRLGKRQRFAVRGQALFV